ncbi:MAG TPA: NYN domain-containing protein [Anaerolineales bacterium]|nr:NYN domain-containing protein [Anaerolineales bacterium]
MGQETQVAVFIDYDNIEISVEEAFGRNIDVDWSRIFNYAAQIGRVVLRRAYADWAESASKQRQLLNMGVELIHVNSKRGKNAADIRIVLDALELFYNEREAFTHVLLISGDGDFTELVHRLRAHGKTVIGLGISGTTADYLVSACDKFVYYDKWQGVNKFKKAPPANGGVKQQPAAKPNPPTQKQQEKTPAQPQNQPSAKPSAPAPISPEKRLERYLGILSAHKIRMTPSIHRPLVIYKLYDLVKENPDVTFNQLKELAQTFFANAGAKIEPQLALDGAHQLFHTYCFEFDSDTSERIMDRKMNFPESVNSPADLLNKCDQKLLQMIVSDLGASETLDREVAATILYGGVRNPKVLDHIQELLDSETQV